jgi:hypothetical protein
MPGPVFSRRPIAPPPLPPPWPKPRHSAGRRPAGPPPAPGLGLGVWPDSVTGQPGPATGPNGCAQRALDPVAATERASHIPGAPRMPFRARCGGTARNVRSRPAAALVTMPGAIGQVWHQCASRTSLAVGSPGAAVGQNGCHTATKSLGYTHCRHRCRAWPSSVFGLGNRRIQHPGQR